MCRVSVNVIGVGVGIVLLSLLAEGFKEGFFFGTKCLQGGE